MFVDLTPEQKKFQADVRAYLDKLITPVVLEEIRGVRREIMRVLNAQDID